MGIIAPRSILLPKVTDMYSMKNKNKSKLKRPIPPKEINTPMSPVMDSGDNILGTLVAVELASEVFSSSDSGSDSGSSPDFSGGGGDFGGGGSSGDW